MEKVRRAVEEQSHRNQSAPWWLFWRRRGHRIGDVEQTLLATGSTPTALQVRDRLFGKFVYSIWSIFLVEQFGFMPCSWPVGAPDVLPLSMLTGRREDGHRLRAQ
jgi:hypothetical protein